MLKDNLKKYRKISGITQKELAERSGVSYSTITKLESGVLTNPSEGILAPIAIILGVKVSDLAPPTADENPFKNIDIALLTHLKANGYTEEKYKEQTGKRTSISELFGTENLVYKIVSDSVDSQLGLLMDDYIPDREKLLKSFDKLNKNGRKEAVKRVEELTEIIRYTNKK